MNKGYRAEWLKFRDEMIERSGSCCERCGRSKFDGIILQIHHKKYVRGRLAWQYQYDDCEVLCKGCHAVEHGLKRPSFGWDYVGDDDLGDLNGECELCGRRLRYIFFVSYPKWSPLEVGEICCNHLTETEIASKEVIARTSYNSRLKRFSGSKRWKMLENRSMQIDQKGFNIVIDNANKSFRIKIDGVTGKNSFKTIQECKKKYSTF